MRFPPPALWVLGEMLRSSDCSSILRPGFIFSIDLPHKPKQQTATGLLAATAPGGTATCEAMILTASRHHDYQAPTTASALLGEVLRTGTMCSALLVKALCPVELLLSQAPRRSACLHVRLTPAFSDFQFQSTSVT